MDMLPVYFICISGVSIVLFIPMCEVFPFRFSGFKTFLFVLSVLTLIGFAITLPFCF